MYLSGMEKIKTFMTNIPYASSAKDLKMLLETAAGTGCVWSVEIQRGKATLRSLGKAVVHFEDQESADRAAQLAVNQQLILLGRTLKLKLNNRHIVHKPKHNLLNIEKGSLSMGYLSREAAMQLLWSSQPGNVTTELDFNTRRVRFFLAVEGTTGRMDYKMEFHFRDFYMIEAATTGRSDTYSLLFKLWSPPRVFRRRATTQPEYALDGSSTATLSLFNDRYEPDLYSCSTNLNIEDYSYYKGIKEEAWVRAVDFTPDSAIGQSLAYLLELADSLTIKTKNDMFNKLADYKLADYPIQSKRLSVQSGLSSVTTQMLVPVVDAPVDFQVDFELMFVLNMLVQLGFINPASLTPRFYTLLQPQNTPLEYAKLALRELLSSGDICYDPENWVKKRVAKYASNRVQVPLSSSLRIEGSLLYIHRLSVSPTKVYCAGPEIDFSNRVTRKYVDEIDNFLRVSFVEEDWENISAAALFSGNSAERSQVFDRILSVMRQGVQLAGKQYEFLAFSSSQLHEQSLWMFASNRRVTAQHIREWMGDFLNIRNVAKCAARMGQCFSSSTATLEVPTHDVKNIPDIERTDWFTSGVKYCFSDGIGKISKEFAERVARKCGFEKMTVALVPSAFQIRYGGYKGVVAVDPETPYKLSLRPSMQKFSSTHIGLEVLSWSKFLPCYLNRQIITLLSTLGVPDAVFEMMQNCVVAQLDAMVHDPAVALEVLQATFSGETHLTVTKMLMAGYHPQTEPYLRSMLSAFRAFQLLNLRTKSRIFVPKGACLIGCLDETATLSYGEVFLQLTPAAGSRRFLLDGLSVFPPYCHGQNELATRVVTGDVVVAKNPCVHPGDVRVLRAVDVPALHHMVNCLVFPQNGHRPHPNECSGSDLDGDLYFVSWNGDLIPPSTDKPMDYTPAKEAILDHPVTVEELQDFFVNHMMNDTLGQIANAHVVHADREDRMARSTKCLKLAKLFAIAVDFSKTGVPAVIPYDLRPDRYPDFMEKEDKITYESSRVIGKLFRAVKEAAHSSLSTPQQTLLTYYDIQLLVSGYENYLEEASSYKHSYDTRLMGLMNQYGIETEGEAISNNIIGLSRHFRKRSGEVKQRIRLAVEELKREARRWFFDVRNDEESDDEDSEFGKQDKYAKASAWYMVSYHPDYVSGDQYSVACKQTVHLLSFPWVVCDILLAIKSTP